MKKARWTLLMLGILLSVYLGLLVPQWMREHILKQRLQDVVNLRNAYLELYQGGSVTVTMSNLIDTLSRKGIHLNNPIPARPDQPCYVLAPETYADFLIIETNTTDPANVVVGLRGGSVGVLNSNQVWRR